MARLADHARVAGDGLIDVAGRVQSGQIARWQGPRGVRSMPAAHLLIQVINHATEHRDQISLILTHLGIEPVDTSGWAYDREQRSSG